MQKFYNNLRLNKENNDQFWVKISLTHSFSYMFNIEVVGCSGVELDCIILRGCFIIFVI